jgi:hypothetical protein
MNHRFATGLLEGFGLSRVRDSRKQKQNEEKNVTHVNSFKKKKEKGEAGAYW